MMNGKRLCLLIILALFSANCLVAKEIKLSKDDETRVKRFLFPLPHELHLRGTALQATADEFSILVDKSVDKLEKKMIDDFQSRWQAEFKQPLKKQNGTLVIVPGIIKNNKILQEAAAKGVFDKKYLAERPNKEQAYVIATESGNGKTTIYVAANDAPGLYYGLLSLEQLLQSLSKKQNLVLPHCQIVDWPDIRLRGSWTILEHGKNNGKILERYSRWKCNLAEAWHIFVDKVDDKGRLTTKWAFPREIIAKGKEYGMTVFPGTGHLSRHSSHPVAKKLFPDAGGTTSSGRKRHRPQALCYSSPDTRKFIDAYMASIARQFDFADIWLAELEGSRGACHCRKCKGNLRRQFTNEVKAVIDAYQKARKINPEFRIMLGLTQGSAPHTYQIIKDIPKDVIINYYDGKVTYRVTFKKYNLPPKAQEIKRQGYTMGVTNSPGQTDMLSPFLAPQYCRMLCGEAEDRGLDFVMSEFWPSPFFHSLNAQAMAEFMWNSSGRTTKEFVISWATRKGLKEPAKTAEVISLIEYPSRCLRATSMKEMLPWLTSFITGKSKKANTMVLYGFESRRKGEAVRALERCDKAIAIARTLNNPKLLADCQMVRFWIYILERNMACVGKKADDESVKNAKKDMITAFHKFPETWRNWLSMNPVNQRTSNTIERRVPEWFLKWSPIFKEDNSKLTPRVKELLDAYNARKMYLTRLYSKLWFKTDKDAKGMQNSYYKGGQRDTSWKRIQTSDKAGWEKHGFHDYAGNAWYSTRWFSMNPALRKKKHLYLYVNGVYGNGTIFINTKKALTLKDGKTDKPFLIDLRSYISKGKKSFCFVSRINGTGVKRGLLSPLIIVGCEKPATIKDIAALIKQLP